MDIERIKQRYNSKRSEDKRVHDHPEQMTDGRLLAQLDDIVQILAGADNMEWVNLHSTGAGRAYLLMLRELRTRLEERRSLHEN